MKDGQFNIRIDTELAAEIKKYAKRNGTSVSSIVDLHFRELLARERTVSAVLATGEVEQV